jgi:hypothetical protein
MSPPSPKEGKRYSFQNVFLVTQNSGCGAKSRNPVILNAVNHHQKPLIPTNIRNTQKDLIKEIW